MFGNVPADARKSNSANTAVLVTSNVTSNKATTTIQNWTVPGYLYQSVVGYVPSDFLANQEIAPAFSLFNSVPSQIGGATPLLLPIGAQICGIQLTNNGVPITHTGGVPNVIISATDTLAPTVNELMLITVGVDVLDGAGGVAKGICAPPYDIYTPVTGAGSMPVVSFPALLTGTFGVSIRVSEASLTAGSLGVVVSYILPGNSFGTTSIVV